MMSESKPTFRELVCALPQKRNLGNVTSLPATKLCEHCSAIAPDRTKLSRYKIPSDFERVDTFPDFPDLKASGKAGCEFCRLLRKTIRATWTSQPFLESDYSVIAEGELEWEQLLKTEWDRKVKIHRLRFEFSSFESFQLGTRLTFNEDTGSDQQHGGMITGMTLQVGPASEALGDDGEPISGEVGKKLAFKVYDSVDLAQDKPSSRRQVPDSSTLSTRNVQMMKDWIRNCKENHEESCQFKESEDWTPTRLLDLGPDAESPPRLITTSDASLSEVKYATLSHLWGDKPDGSCPLQCLESNLEEFQAGIELELLNANFRDAIAVCHALDIQYLWIDALCIIQDSDEDREQEMALVHKVFRNSEVTLVSTSATNPQSGFLNRYLDGTPAINVQYGETKDSLILSPVESLDVGTRETDVEQSPWNRWAWSMVERALSNRLIYFCKNRLYYECRWSLRSEESGAESIDGRISPLWPRTNDLDKQSGRPFFYQAWQNFLTEFSGKKILRPADRATAMANIANEMSESIEDTYLSNEGAWGGNLRKDLLWYNEEAPTTKESQAEVPSWSWSKVDGKIGFIRGATDGELRYPFKGKPPFALQNYYEDGSIEAKGYLKSFSTLQHVDKDDEFLMEMRKEYPYDLVIENGEEEPSTLAQGALDFDNLDSILSSGKELFYLHVEAETHPTGLIVQEEEEGRFQRVGVATLFDFGGELLLDPPFVKSDSKVVHLI